MSMVGPRKFGNVTLVSDDDGMFVELGYGSLLVGAKGLGGLVPEVEMKVYMKVGKKVGQMIL